jgi:hypothetical protein
MIIRGGNEGGLDGFDVWGTNIWVQVVFWRRNLLSVKISKAPDPHLNTHKDKEHAC